MIGRRWRNALKGGLYALFRFGQRFGVDILPRHFYSSIPDIAALSRTNYWRAPLDMIGVAGADIGPQLAFARACGPEQLRLRLADMDLAGYAARENGAAGYNPVDAEFLYFFISTRRPHRVVQVGAGVSTAVILKAAADAGHTLDLICVDPFPTDYLKRCRDGGRIQLVAEPAQTVSRRMLCDLGEGGLLFVDSTHTVKVASEVNRIILDIMPRLVRGAWVHFHDIYFPYDYHRSLFYDPFFPVESSLLHAFLIHNSRYTLRCSLAMLHYAAAGTFRELLPSYRPPANHDGLGDSYDAGELFPSSAWLEVTG